MSGLMRMAARNLVRQPRRYRLLGAAVGFSFFIIALIASVLTGMVDALEEKAKLYYGGDISIRGMEDGSYPVVKDGPALRKTVRDMLGPGPIISERYEHRAISTMLYFGGEGLRQRILIGIDFSTEAELFARFNYVEGGAEGIKGTNGILVSEPMARALKARVGDDLLLLVPTLAGQKNTATVVVRGIFRDSSLFGYYTSYLDIDFLRDLVGMPREFSSQIAIFYPHGRPSRALLQRLQSGLEAKFPFFPLFDRRQAFLDKAAAEHSPGMKYCLLSLDSNLEQVKPLLDAVYSIALILIAMLLGIVMLGVSGSYKVIVHERTREIGTMRAIGMQGWAAARLFMFEAGLLAALASFVGGLFAWAGLGLLGLFDFSFIPSFDIFLRGGRLDASLPLGLGLSIAALLILTAVAAVAGPALRAARINPSEAMGKEA